MGLVKFRDLEQRAPNQVLGHKVNLEGGRAKSFSK